MRIGYLPENMWKETVCTIRQDGGGGLFRPLFLKYNRQGGNPLDDTGFPFPRDKITFCVFYFEQSLFRLGYFQALRPASTAFRTLPWASRRA